MKWMSHILAVLMLALAILPCSDLEGSLHDGEVLLVHTDCDQDNHEGTESDGCSPFCTCQCCQIPIHCAGDAGVVNLFLPQSQEQLDVYLECYSDDFTLSFWRPPQHV